EYALLGDSVADGLFTWISVAVNMSANQEVETAATLTANGGVATSDSVIGGGAGGSGNFGGSMGGFGGSLGGFGGSVGGFGVTGPASAGRGKSSIEGDADVTVSCGVRK
ncbi:hypothetical protein PF005_g11708, partial [Phytophthora fragariae]